VAKRAGKALGYVAAQEVAGATLVLLSGQATDTSVRVGRRND
jgi:hypothetical protein